MSQLAQRKGFKIESTLPTKKKTKEKKSKSKVVEHVHIIDDDAPIPWDGMTAAAPTATTKTKTKANRSDPVMNDEIVLAEDAPVIVGIVDERPADIREKERFKDLKRWRTAAFEEVPELGSIGPKPKPAKSSRQKQDGSDDSDPDLDRRQTGKHNDPDLSPPRRRTQQKDDDPSPPRRRRHSSDDPSPPRRRDSSPPRRKDQHKRDSSPPRRRETSSPPPPRKRYHKEEDASPPRRRDKSSPSHRRKESSPVSTHERRPKQESSPPPTQPAKSQRRRLAEHKEEVSERYAQWGRGLAQVRQAKEAVQDYIEQAEKPLARYRNDQDLDALLKQREREDDPMLKYLSNKPSDTGDRTTSANKPPTKPRYKGPDPQKNRFDIWPGYRWDGVDRSNGYEKKLFESIANRHAKSQEAYLWSVEDM